MSEGLNHNYLEHYGVKGMKWDQSKKKKTSKRITKETIKKSLNVSESAPRDKNRKTYLEKKLRVTESMPRNSSDDRNALEKALNVQKVSKEHDERNALERALNVQKRPWVDNTTTERTASGRKPIKERDERNALERALNVQKRLDSAKRTRVSDISDSTLSTGSAVLKRKKVQHIDDSLSLEHYGILGMKWGVRRTPEQLGHKPRTPTEKWKVKQLDQIDRLYNKSYKKLDKAYKQDPADESIMKYKKQLESQQKKDREKIEKMSFVDVEQAREVEKEERTQKRKEAVQAVGGAAMWTAKMALIGVRIGGTVALLNVLSDAGRTAMDFISSPEGQATLKKGGEVISMFGNGELTALGIAKKFIVGNAPKSNAAKALSTLEVENLMPGANYVSPEQIGNALNVKLKDL